MHEFVYDSNMLVQNTMPRNVAANSINVLQVLIRSCPVDIYGLSCYGMDQLIIAFSRLLLEFAYNVFTMSVGNVKWVWSSIDRYGSNIVTVKCRK